MRSEISIVENAIDGAMVEVRAIYSALREADTQVERTERKLSGHRDNAAKLRLRLGRKLIEVRSQWPARGPKAKGWGEFLEREGIPQRTAYELMQLAGFVEVSAHASEGAEIDELPTRREITAARRASEEQPDLPSHALMRHSPIALVEEPGARRTGGRGKPQWLMQAIVADYTRTNDLVCDPLAGFGSTLTAAMATGRRAIGSEIDPEIARVAAAELRVGDWRSALADIGDVDAVITDPPFSQRTHEGSRRHGNARLDGVTLDGIGPSFAHWTRDDVHEFVKHWSPRCRGWMVALTDHSLFPYWEEAYEDVNRYCHAPVPCVMRGMSVRLCNDGPSSWTVYAIVARPKTKEFVEWGVTPGAYVGTRERRWEGE